MLSDGAPLTSQSPQVLPPWDLKVSRERRAPAFKKAGIYFHQNIPPKSELWPSQQDGTMVRWWLTLSMAQRHWSDTGTGRLHQTHSAGYVGLDACHPLAHLRGTRLSSVLG